MSHLTAEQMAHLSMLAAQDAVTTRYETALGLTVWRRDDHNHDGSLRQVNLALEDPGLVRNWSGFVRVSASNQGLYQRPFGPGIDYNGTSVNEVDFARKLGLLLLEAHRLVIEGLVV